MTKQIARQFWKHHTAEALVKRELDVVRENAFRSKRGYDDCLLETISQLYEETQSTIAVYGLIKNQLLIESLGTVVSGGLEITLTSDENQEISEDQLVLFASWPTRKKYNETRVEAQKLCDVYNLLRKKYIEL